MISGVTICFGISVIDNRATSFKVSVDKMLFPKEKLSHKFGRLFPIIFNQHTRLGFFHCNDTSSVEKRPLKVGTCQK